METLEGYTLQTWFVIMRSLSGMRTHFAPVGYVKDEAEAHRYAAGQLARDREVKVLPVTVLVAPDGTGREVSSEVIKVVLVRG